MPCIQRDTYTCKVCKEDKTEYKEQGHDQICSGCKKKEKEQKDRGYFEALDKLSMEERIRKIEKWIYDYKPPQNPMADFYG